MNNFRFFGFFCFRGIRNPDVNYVKIVRKERVGKIDMTEKQKHTTELSVPQPFKQKTRLYNKEFKKKVLFKLKNSFSTFLRRICSKKKKKR